MVRDLQGPLPAPDSEEFFKLYGEPLHNWIVALIILAEAISLEDWDTLNKLISSVARVRWFSEDRIGRQIAFPSLLCAFAEMYFQDVEDGSRLGHCASCGELFVGDRRWAEYCSRACASKRRQQRFRQANPDYYKRRNGRRTTVDQESGKPKL